MFDKIDRSDRSTHIKFPDTIEVKEYKAPTDESIRLADEFMEKAIQRVVKSLQVEINFLKASILVITDDLVNDQLRLFIKFNLNGHDFKFEDKINRYDLNQEFHKWGSLGSKCTVQQVLITEFTKVLMRGLIVQSKHPITDWKVTEHMIDNTKI